MGKNEIFIRYGENNIEEGDKYMKVSDSLLQNWEISYCAKGFLLYLLSLSKGKTFNAKDYEKVSKKNEECKLDDLLRELVKHKYVLPFHKKDGLVEECRYVFNDESFDVEKTAQVKQQMSELGYTHVC